MGRRTEKTTHSDPRFAAIRAPLNRFPVRVGKSLSWLAALGLAGLSTSATALDGRLTSGKALMIQPAESILLPAYDDHQPAAEAEQTSWVNRWMKKTLASVPLRPIRIGETPRRPDDPEPAMGVVLKLPF